MGAVGVPLLDEPTKGTTASYLINYLWVPGR